MNSVSMTCHPFFHWSSIQTKEKETDYGVAVESYIIKTTQSFVVTDRTKTSCLSFQCELFQFLVGSQHQQKKSKQDFFWRVFLLQPLSFLFFHLHILLQKCFFWCFMLIYRNISWWICPEFSRNFDAFCRL